MQIWKVLVNDLDGELFEKAVLDICKHTEKFWESDNVPGMIRAKVMSYKDDVKRLEMIESNRLRIDQWAKDAAPMPEEYRKTLAAYKIPKVEGKK